MTPRFPIADASIGLDALSFDSTEDAITHFEDLIFQEPRNATGHRELAKLYRDSNRPSEARQHEEAATAISKHPLAEKPPPAAALPRAPEVKHPPTAQSKLEAVSVALALHLALILLLAFWLIGSGSTLDSPIQVIAAAGDDAPDPSADLLRSLRQKPRPINQPTPVATEIASNAPTPIVLPPIHPEDFDRTHLPSFGSAIAAEGISAPGNRAGTVEFFGVRSKAERAVFIVDFSSSMLKGQRLPRLKKELNKALANMPDGMLYNIIYYSDDAWLSQTRHGKSHKRHLPEQVQWLVANPSAKQLSSMEIASMEAEGTTFWAPPLRAALTMNPKPDLIWLLSDGDAADRESLLRKLGRMVGDDIRINTVGLELGGIPFQSLVDIAEKTGGTYSIIMGGTPHHGKDALRFTHPVYGKPEN